MDFRKISETTQNIIYTTLSVVLVYGITGLALVYGWILFGAVWGTIAAVAVLALCGFLLKFPVDYLRARATRDFVSECVGIIQNYEEIHRETRQKLISTIRTHFGV